MSKKLWIKEAVLHRTPGFGVGTFPPIRDFSEGLNVVWGPNGVGKSSLSRGLCSLLWDKQAASSVEAEGTLETPDGQWHLNLFQGTLKQTRLRDNQDTSLPGRVDDLSDSYWFPLHVLLQAEETGKTFLYRVQKEMQGDVDLKGACLQVGGKRTWTTSNNNDVRNLKEAEANYKRIKAQQESQKDIHERIAALQDAVDSTSILQKQKAFCEQERQLLQFRSNIGDLEAKSDTFPPQISLVNEKSPERLKELRKGLLEKEQDFEEAKRELQRLQELFSQCEITKSQFDDSSLPEKIEASLARFQEARKDLEETQKTYDQQAAALKTWEEQHAWIMDKAPENQNLGNKVSVLKKLANQCEPLRCTVISGQQYLSSLGNREQESENDVSLASLSTRLGDWMRAFAALQATPEGTLIPKTLRRRVVLVALLGALVVGLLSFLHPLATVPGSLALVFLLWRMIPKSEGTGEKEQKTQALAQLQEQIEQEMKKVPGISLADWSVESCLLLQRTLAAKLQENQNVRERNKGRRVASDTLQDSREKLGAWQLMWKSACDDLGFSIDNPTLEGAEFFHFSEQLKRWVDLVENEAIGGETLQRANNLYQKALKQLQSILSTEECDSATLEGTAKSLEKRINRAHELQISIDSQITKVSNLQQDLQEKRREYELFWEKLGIDYEDERTLQEVASLVSNWQELQMELALQKKQEAALLAKDPESERGASEKSREEVDSQIAFLEQRLRDLGDKQKELGGLENEYKNLINGSALATAMLRKKQAEEALETLRQQEVLSNVIGLLADKLSALAQQDCQPKVLLKASEWMKRITQGRYMLSVNDEGFFAHDTVQNANFKLDELSSGTRVQLLFSVRMAFIESQELSSGVHFPIFLDELLANSDDDRAMAIAQAIEEIAKDRQVFYFTAQRDEVEKLRSLNVANFQEIALFDLQRGYAVDRNPRPAFTFSKPAIPEFSPDYNLFGERCMVSGPSLWEPIEKLHSWYLETDSEKLRVHLAGGQNYIGQVIATLGSKDPVLNHRYELLAKAQVLATEGRCRQLTKSDLDAEDLPLNRKSQYWQQLVDVVTDHAMDGKDLLKEIEQGRIKRFNDESRQILSDWLYEHQFATNEIPYSKQDILGKLYASDPAFTIGSEDRMVVERYLDGVVE
ncbi:hypothetical protein SpiGrapes_0874 [Sphaerochaeta pleomorpha str. Grapes]|uniref:Rad50/SbcC-type AAA domain-containing protein n=1 Tax=Sphaerochaeta pleomorpha (strain ATCC BAA-1885 / DSM 22778 / Grapes) TaxID=158190 RepID=G8QQR9_SPHPG|nr:AAA family ATPase [Sphaerochaeta pleomorpha]AEV28700.1 hypothetical protein SpiGrapes_0874 [Sphaerochaeta pleomorpha str. Grapes]